MSVDFTTLTHMSPLVTKERLNEALTNWFNQEYTFTHWETSFDDPSMWKKPSVTKIPTYLFQHLDYKNNFPVLKRLNSILDKQREATESQTVMQEEEHIH